MNLTVPTTISGHPIRLLPHRVEFHRERPTWEAERIESMARHVRPGWTIIDAGAEEGDFTALYRSWVGDAGWVVAVEPSPGYWPAIRATWEGNGFGPAPMCIPAFAADRTWWPEPSAHWPDEAEQAITLGADGWPIASSGPISPDYGFRMLCERVLDTPGWRMDELPYRPDAIVFDIEGAEWHAMSGCQRLCEPGGCRPLLWVSVHEENMIRAYERKLGDLIRLALSWDYGYRYLGSHGGEDFWLFHPAEVEP